MILLIKSIHLHPLSSEQGSHGIGHGVLDSIHHGGNAAGIDDSRIGNTFQQLS